MRRKMLLFYMLLLFISCDTPKIFEHTVFFEDLIWNRFNHIELDVPIEDINSSYDLKFRFVHTENYAADHIAINFTVYFSNGGMRSGDYVFTLQDDNLQWTGTKKNNTFTADFPLLSGMRFPDTGISKMRIENKMTKFNMTGIVGAGLVVEKSKE